eukprot:scaffold25001_cov57-Phaeocystis_antarctica.AAC.2
MQTSEQRALPSQARSGKRAAHPTRVASALPWQAERDERAGHPYARVGRARQAGSVLLREGRCVMRHMHLSGELSAASSAVAGRAR